MTLDRALDPDGFEIKRAIVQHGGSAVMMPVDDRGRILAGQAVSFARTPVYVGAPAGRVDPGETPLKAAQARIN